VKEQVYGKSIDRKKTVAVGILFVVSAAITLLGLSFCVYSVLNQVELAMLQTKVPGAVFGLVIAFLGIRYFLAVRKLKIEVYKSTSRFSLSNFKKKQRTHAL
jgi:hypothetical protein